MAEQPLIFLIRDIPDGASVSEVDLRPRDHDLASTGLEKGRAVIEWNKNAYYIEAVFRLDAVLRLSCDRSLEQFSEHVTADYRVVFKPDAEDVADEASASRPFSTDGTHIDLSQDIRDTLMLQIPLRPIHPRFFNEDGELTDFETASFGGSEPKAALPHTDPRWDKLRTLQTS